MIYLYKGNKYAILREGKSKHPDSGEWYDAVFYVAEKDGELYCRAKNEFFSLFEPEVKVPYHVQQIGKFFSVSQKKGNLATGKIRKFEGRVFLVGRQMLTWERLDAGDSGFALWVHLGANFYKMIELFPEFAEYKFSETCNEIPS